MRSCLSSYEFHPPPKKKKRSVFKQFFLLENTNAYMFCLRMGHNEATALRKELKREDKWRWRWPEKRQGHTDTPMTRTRLAACHRLIPTEQTSTHPAYIIVTLTYHGELITHLLMTERWTGSH